ncbi:hypothetical protein BCR37DRAFT_389179 [Protomyces lactucae-debilis]|uniref:Uncharacterized protein n=1 Tax=Protomyces lactucae-debilis TaxID=2754530 RepID=A0A1Y2F0K5_PROLT|nr:uncharacterized protein BCR37DRAFT_389179 [Protomyces lactucae-debilis]ORY77370.1 hypothetical protein BCR37DRAFT_389179 [Protomyces lactucae-debilis]
MRYPYSCLTLLFSNPRISSDVAGLLKHLGRFFIENRSPPIASLIISDQHSRLSNATAMPSIIFTMFSLGRHVWLQLSWLIFAAHILTNWTDSQTVLGVRTPLPANERSRQSLGVGSSSYEGPSPMPSTYSIIESSQRLCYNVSFDLLKLQPLQLPSKRKRPSDDREQSSTSVVAHSADCSTACTDQINSYIRNWCAAQSAFTAASASCIRAQKFRIIRKSYIDHSAGKSCSKPGCNFAEIDATCACELSLGFDWIHMPLKKYDKKSYHVHPEAESDWKLYGGANTFRCSVSWIQDRLKLDGWQAKSHTLYNVLIPCGKDPVLQEGCTCYPEDYRRGLEQCLRHTIDAKPCYGPQSSEVLGCLRLSLQDWQNLYNSWESHCDWCPNWPLELW